MSPRTGKGMMNPKPRMRTNNPKGDLVFEGPVRG